MLPDDVPPGEGDCDHDDQCAGLLECGNNNCLTKTGGLWDQGRVQHYKEITDSLNPLYICSDHHIDIMTLFLVVVDIADAIKTSP